MAALLDISRRTSEASYQKIAQAMLGAFQVMGRIHGSQYFVSWYLPVKCGSEARETFFSDALKYFLIVQLSMVTRGTIEPCARFGAC
jgi:hypothetical protein